MNVSILTVYDAPNCGSFLQAYATKRILESKGYQVSFIRYRQVLDEIKLLFANERTNLKHPLFSICKGICYIKAQKQNFELITLEKAKMESQKFIIGSDELWNVRNDKYFSKSMFYGSEFETESILVLAISCNEAQSHDFEPLHQSQIKRLKYLTFRDKYTGEVIGNFNSNAKFCCDPTIIVDLDELSHSYPKRLPQKYMVLYAYSFTAHQRDVVTQYARKHDLKIISMCSAFIWADINLVCSPLYFSEIIRNAACVVSATFHGCVFSILHNKNAICMKASPKIVDLLNRYKCDDMICLNPSQLEFEKIINKEREWDSINTLLATDREIGERLLNAFLAK